MQANWSPEKKIKWLSEQAERDGMRPFEREELYARACAIYIRELGLPGSVECENEYNGAMRLAELGVPVVVKFKRPNGSLEPLEIVGPVTLIPHNGYKIGSERFLPDKTSFTYKDKAIVGGTIWTSSSMNRQKFDPVI
jgi:hypothetical protein